MKSSVLFLDEELVILKNKIAMYEIMCYNNYV